MDMCQADNKLLILRNDCLLKIRSEVDKSFNYLKARDSDEELLTVGECMQEIGHIKMFIQEQMNRVK
jgi:hypothetical protein